ncbi:hypothetical protein Glove_420g43 [Diversispora epigaea]|uniref:Uncharacterized protein n=1 Tax=Diversispora epigaea TaxID=1348612 RepID=A0A397GZQ6_9GLOM|nr:hypothetical protein Glove_420g43 [Diversispora epigaea]
MNAFFTNLKDIWLKRQPSTFIYNGNRKNFIEDELYTRLEHANYNFRKEHFGQVNEISTRVISRASICNAKKVYATKKSQKLQKVTYKCSNCRKIGYRKNKCPKLEDEPMVVLDDSDEEGSEDESIFDNEPQSCFNQKVFLESLKYMISELIPNCPFKVWKIVAKKYLTIFQPFIELLNNQSSNSLSYKDMNQNYYFVPYPNIPEKLDNSMAYVKDTEIKIDKKNIHKLIGAVGDSQFIGTSYNVPIAICTRRDSITVHEDISVIPTKKDQNGKNISTMILGTKWQHHAGWDSIVKGEFVATHNGKTITILLSTHKEKYSHNVTASDNIFNIEKRTNNSCSDTDRSVSEYSSPSSSFNK